MRSARKEPNQRVYKASPEKTSGRGSAPARHAAKHAKKRSLFGRAKQENSVPETAAPALQPEVAEEEHTYTAPAAPPSAIPPVEPVLTPPARRSREAEVNVLQPASQPEAAAPQPAEQDDSAAALNTTGAAVPEGDESAEKAAPAEKKSSRSKLGSRREERESVLTSFQRFLDTLSIRLLCEVFLRQVRRLFVVGVVVYADVHVRTDHGQELFGHYHHVAELRRERDRQDAQRRPLQRIGIFDAGVS